MLEGLCLLNGGGVSRVVTLFDLIDFCFCPGAIVTLYCERLQRLSLMLVMKLGNIFHPLLSATKSRLLQGLDLIKYNFEVILLAGFRLIDNLSMIYF